MIKLTIDGNLTSDAQVKTAKNGTKFVTFCVADNYKAGEDRHDEVRFINVTDFSSDCVELVTNPSKGLKKGDRVSVYGKLNPCRIYTAKDNTQKISYDVVTRCTEFIHRPQQQVDAAAIQNAYQPTAATSVQAPTVDCGTFQRPVAAVAASSTQEGVDDLPF